MSANMGYSAGVDGRNLASQSAICDARWAVFARARATQPWREYCDRRYWRLMALRTERSIRKIADQLIAETVPFGWDKIEAGLEVTP